QQVVEEPVALGAHQDHRVQRERDRGVDVLVAQRVPEGALELDDLLDGVEVGGVPEAGLLHGEFSRGEGAAGATDLGSVRTGRAPFRDCAPGTAAVSVAAMGARSRAAPGWASDLTQPSAPSRSPCATSPRGAASIRPSIARALGARSPKHRALPKVAATC